MGDIFGGGADIFGTPGPAPAPAAGGDIFGTGAPAPAGGDIFGTGAPAPAGGDIFGTGAPAPAAGGGDIFGSTDIFGSSAGGAGVYGAAAPLFPPVWPDETMLDREKYSDIVKRDKARLQEFCKKHNQQPGTYQSEFQLYFEQEPVNKTGRRVPSHLPAGFFTRRLDPRKGNTKQLVPVGVMVLLYQYDQRVRAAKQTVAEKIQRAITQLKKLSAGLRRNTLKHKNAMANKYRALTNNAADGSGGDQYGSSRGRDGGGVGVGGDGTARSLREMLSRDIRIMQYVSSSSGDVGGGMGRGGGVEFPSSHVQVEVEDLYRRKRELGIQIRELESALLGSGAGAGGRGGAGAGGGGDLSSDLVRIIEEQFKMYENIAAKVAVIHRRVEEEKQAIRAELRANPDGKGDPWLEERLDPTEKRFREDRELKEKKVKKEKAERAAKAEKKVRAEAKKEAKAAKAVDTSGGGIFGASTADPFGAGGTDIFGNPTTGTKPSAKTNKEKKKKSKNAAAAASADIFGTGSIF